MIVHPTQVGHETLLPIVATLYPFSMMEFRVVKLYDGSKVETLEK